MSKLQEIFRKNVLLHLGDRSKNWLAKESGLNSGSIQTALSPDGNATVKTIEAIADALQIHPAVLLGGTEGKTLNIPNDILEMLDNESPIVHDTIRTLLKALNSERDKRNKK